MGFLDSLFGNSSDDNNEKEVKFYSLELISQLDEIDAISEGKPVVIFKHSTRCSISRFALKQFDAAFNYPEDKIDWYLLDLLNHRDISNEIAHRYNVQHQSPQILVIKSGKAVYHDSHDGIDANDLKQFV
ncbi:bacillithiol system redox-active protein YtxJ [Flavobacterium ponti]|uniref:Bacillithiol system redox-active protein YtxJ n=1 Tax=Flavobacterium ponti TaxID=665133 RepID=A0ABV9P6Y9_9FLAO